jgi:predicted 3-demethylubiquinone-9 3-methyltransferase (glyoxalase superfamily)
LVELARWVTLNFDHFSRHGSRLYFEHIVRLISAWGCRMPPATVLNDHLEHRRYVLGDALTVADFTREPFTVFKAGWERNAMATVQKISPCLWFDGQGEEAAQFYVSVFKNSRMGSVTRFGKEGFEVHGRPEGSAMTVTFFLEGEEFTALNGGPLFKFNEAISFVVRCQTQAEIDHFWNRLGEGGDPKAQQCGWLKDRFGLSWQIVPAAIQEMFKTGDTVKAGRVMNAVLKMKKLDLAVIQKAYDGA